MGHGCRLPVKFGRKQLPRKMAFLFEYVQCVHKIVRCDAQKKKEKENWLADYERYYFFCRISPQPHFFLFAFLYVDVLSSNLRDNESAYPFSIGC